MKKKVVFITIFSSFQLIIAVENSGPSLKKIAKKKEADKTDLKKHIETKKKIEPIQHKMSSLSDEKLSQSLNETSTLKKKESSRTILLNNEITEETITYNRHWYKPFPSDFKISINDQEYISLQNGKPKLHEKLFTIAKNKVKITYEWALNKFGKLWHTEKKEMEFEIPPDRKELNMKFSWNDDNRIIIDNAKMVMCANLDQTKKPT